ncbi:excitatory amino acid transporter 1-like isoform X2 [Hyperolius riggenbachi]|uniref:excitatory amino acid transporter 1-like isoform X2 n=1 Tax=Hyperolius riggenbachi TaxID=752182 RepID=UPI0035A3B5C7
MQHTQTSASGVAESSANTCKDQHQQQRMSEKDGNADNLFLKDYSAKGEKPEGRMHNWQHAMRKRASRAGKQVRTVTLGSIRGFLCRNAFVILTITAVVLGIGLAFALRPYKMSYRQIKYFSFPGELLMRMLQMLVLPLIVSSLVTGMASLDGKASGKMGMRAVVYYTVTTFIAVFIGIIMVIIIHPGKGTKENMESHGKIERVQATDAILDLIRNMFPPNLVEACFKQYKTQYNTRVFKVPVAPDLNITSVTEQTTEAINVSGIVENVTRAMEKLQEIIELEEIVPTSGSANGVNALGLVVFSLCFGLVIGHMKEQGRALKEFFDCLNEAIMRLVAIIIWYAPIGIMFLISGKILEMDDLLVMGGQLGMYTITVIIGLLIHAVVVLPLLFFIVTRRNPWPFIGGLLQALITALGTSSSSATLPITFKCLEDNNGVDKRVTRFVLPVGATINMDGTALYEALAAIFIAQVNNYELNFGQIITIRDRLRTTTNVLGDSLGAGIVEHLSRHELRIRDADLGNSVLEETEKPYQLICTENDIQKHPSGETCM